MRPLRLTVAAAATLAVAVSCGDDGGTAGCVELREALDPLSIQHVIDDTGVTYLTDPPTSGPHASGPAVSGALSDGIPPAAQVRVLEAGGVVVQYRPPIDAAALEPLLDRGDEVSYAIAPATGLPAPVIATAWTWKMTCDAVDVDRIAAFATSRSTDAPGED